MENRHEENEEELQKIKQTSRMISLRWFAKHDIDIHTRGGRGMDKREKEGTSKRNHYISISSQLLNNWQQIQGNSSSAKNKIQNSSFKRVQ